MPPPLLTTRPVATIEFLVRGGDGYPFAGVDFTVLPITDREAFETYLARTSPAQ